MKFRITYSDDTEYTNVLYLTLEAESLVDALVKGARTTPVGMDIIDTVCEDKLHDETYIVIDGDHRNITGYLYDDGGGQYVLLYPDTLSKRKNILVRRDVVKVIRNGVIICR